MSFDMMFPPGYLSLDSARRMVAHKKSVMGGQTVDSLMEQDIIIFGSPDTVRKKLTQAHNTLGFQNFVALLQFGTLPRDLTERNIRLFTSEVAPALRDLTDKQYAGFEVSKTPALA